MKKLFILGLVSLSFLFPSKLLAQESVLIASKDVPYSVLPKEDVRNILLGYKTKWPNGQLIKVAILGGGDCYEATIHAFTSKSRDQYEKFWKKQVFTGNGVMPDFFKTDADVIGFVTNNPGAFGFVSPAADVSAVKVLKSQ